MAETPARDAALRTIDHALVQLILDGTPARAQIGEDLRLRTGRSLPDSSLVIIGRLHNKAIRLTQLAQLVGVTPSTMSRQIQQLERKGFIDRTADEQDGRATIVTLSEGGLRMAEVLSAVRDAFLQRILEGWSEEDILLLSPLLERLAIAFSREVEDDREGPQVALGSMALAPVAGQPHEPMRRTPAGR